MVKLNIQPTEKQWIGWRAFQDQETDVIIFGGGAGGGKSWFICESRLLNALSYPGYKSFIARNELKRLMATTFLTFKKVCKFHNIPQSAWRLNGQYNYIEFNNGSRIDLLDAKYYPMDSEFERFGSLEYTDGAFDEIGEIHADAFDVLKSRVNRHMNEELGLKGNVIGSLNPSDNWVKSTYYLPYAKIRDRLKSEGRFDNKTAISFLVEQPDGDPEKVVFIESLYTDNHHTAKDYGATLGKLRNAKNRARLKDGNWDFDGDPTRMITDRAIYDAFDKIDPIGEKAVPSDYWITADVARYGADKAVFYVWRGLQLIKRIEYAKSGIDTLLKQYNGLRREHEVRKSQSIADDDGVGGGLVDMAGIIGFVNGSKALHGENFQNLKTQCAYKLAEYWEAGKIGIDDDVFTDEQKAKVIAELKQLKEADWDKDGKLKIVSKEKMKENLGGRSPDDLDNFIMRMLGELDQNNGEFVTIL